MNNIFCIEKKQEERHWRMLRVSHLESMKQTWNNCKQRNKDIEVEQCLHDDDMLASSESAKKDILKKDSKRLLSVKSIQKVKTEKASVLVVW